MNQYRIENNDDVKLWFQCDRIEYSVEDELIKGYIQTLQIVEYPMNVGDSVYSVEELNEIYRRDV